MNVLGLAAFYHESACCLLQDGQLVAAAEEERFSRRKHDPGLPIEAFRFCLEAGGLAITDLDAVAYYEDPVKKLARQLWAGPPRPPAARRPPLDPGWPERRIRQGLGWEGPLLSYAHHASHAASAFYFSGFPAAALLTVDGVGEWATTSYGCGDASGLELFEEVEFPHSLGLLYSTLTAYLGFAVNDGEYKVMGLAPYGEPRFRREIERLVRDGPDGQFRLDLRYFDFLRGERMFSPALPALFGQPPRRPEAAVEPFHRDVARSLQLVLEELLLAKVRYLHARVPAEALAMAGGVALNCVANGRILREGPFTSLFVQPAAGDAGGCLGAAALAHRELSGLPPSCGPQRHAYLGPRFAPAAIAAWLQDLEVPHQDFAGREAELVAATARRLAARQVVGWFHGAMEMGPRALGARSILGNPLDPDIRDHLNRRVKRREAFRPFAPAVLRDRAGAHFDLSADSPFMLLTCQVRSPLDLPGITHVDGSARVQTVDPALAPRFAALLTAFEALTGCPILVNTSFNVRGEPIVCTPADALCCFAASGLDALVLEDCLIEHRDLDPALPGWLAAWGRGAAAGGPSAISEQLYTFV